MAGAPRTTIVRMAAATSAAVQHSTSTSSAGSRRWSRKTTRSSSRRRIRSGSSNGLDVDAHRQAAEGGAIDREHDVPDARANTRGYADRRPLVGHRHDQAPPVVDEAVEPHVGRTGKPVEEGGDDDPPLEVHPGDAGVLGPRETTCPAGDIALPDCEVRVRLLRTGGLGRTHETECDQMLCAGGQRRRHTRKDDEQERREAAQVPSSHDARYLACSSVSVSIVTPIVASFSRAISSSISVGTGYTFFSSEAAC